MEADKTQSLNTVPSNEATLSFSNLSPESQFNPQGRYDQLNELFNQQDKQQKDVQEAREILGESARDLTDSQVYDLTNEIQYLVDSWLEEFERKTFDGKTLNELLGLDAT
ncbi:MAG: hypothetical protein Q8P92_04445 [Candidatus Daviesbacteria bacterium]|nr:hypothetical protein [Candidatus Daviesbacteria bacterium]